MKHLTLSLFTALLAVTVWPAQAADRSVGVLIGEFGPGLNYSKSLPFSLKENDHLQLRLQLSGLSTGEESGLTIENNSYTGDFDLGSHKVTADWYPFERRSFFVTAGLGYVKSDFNLKDDDGEGYTVGDTVVGADGSSLSLDIDQSSVAPYIGIGWGNKLKSHDGLSFFAELGVLKPLSDAKVGVASDSTTVSQADLDKEQREIKDAFGDLRLSAALGLTYRF